MSAPPLLDLHDLGLEQTGNESWARSLAAALLACDGPGSYDVAVTSAADAGDLRRLEGARERVQISRTSAVRLVRDLPRAARRLGSPSMLVQYTAPLSRVPAVVAVHDLSFEDKRSAEWLPLTTRLRYRGSVRTSVRRAAHVVVSSEYTRQDLLARYRTDPARVTVVPIAIDPRFATLLQETPQHRASRPTVVVVGNVLPRKNLPVVSKAVRLMRDRGLDVDLRIVGTVQPTGRADADYVRELLGDAVTVTGYLPPSELARELRCAHALAFPSLFEGFGIPVLEAMAADLPVVVSDRTSLPEVVGDAGLVVPAEDAEGWAAALTSVLDDPAAMVERGRERVATFSWQRSALLVSELLATAH